MRRSGATLEELENLYRARYAVFIRVARAIVRDDEAAADAVHDAFVHAVRSRCSFRGEGTVEAWLWHIVVNAARKRFRQESNAAHVLETAVSQSENGFGDPVRAAIAALPERQRLMLFLRYYADLDYAAIAVALEVRVGTVGATLNAAHGALRSVLKEVQTCRT